MQSLRCLLCWLSIIVVVFYLAVAEVGAPAPAASVYEVLKLHGLPTGLLPKGVNNFSLDDSGKFEVHLDRACNALFENELHYDMNISGILGYGEIDALSGISAKDLFLWLPVVAIRVDIPSSGLIYFNISVVSKQFAQSLFESPRECLAAPASDLHRHSLVADTISEINSGKIRHWHGQDDEARTGL